MIKLQDGWGITKDEFQYILGRPSQRIHKDGRVSIDMQDASYHRTMEQAVEYFIKMQHRDWITNHDTDLPGALEALSQITDEIRSSLQESGLLNL